MPSDLVMGCCKTREGAFNRPWPGVLYDPVRKQIVGLFTGKDRIEAIAHQMKAKIVSSEMLTARNVPIMWTLLQEAFEDVPQIPLVILEAMRTAKHDEWGGITAKDPTLFLKAFGVALLASHQDEHAARYTELPKEDVAEWKAVDHAE